MRNFILFSSTNQHFLESSRTLTWHDISATFLVSRDFLLRHFKTRSVQVKFTIRAWEYFGCIFYFPFFLSSLLTNSKTIRIPLSYSKFIWTSFSNPKFVWASFPIPNSYGLRFPTPNSYGLLFPIPNSYGFRFPYPISFGGNSQLIVLFKSSFPGKLLSLSSVKEP